MDSIISKELSKTIRQKFDDIKMITKEGNEYWSARDLLSTLEYESWDKFLNPIDKAIKSIETAGHKVNDHFLQVEKMVDIGSKAKRKVSDFFLSKYACFLIAQNADPSKGPVAEAQAYFALQTHKQEVFEELSSDGRSLLVREEVIDHNKKLGDVADKAGVKKFGTFNDAGYQGLYGMRYKDIVKHKHLGDDKLLDRAGETELAANLFRITQTHDQLKQRLGSGDAIGESDAVTTHFIVGEKVRKAIKDIGGTMPEHLLLEEHIKHVKSRIEEDRKISKINTSKGIQLL